MFLIKEKKKFWENYDVVMFLNKWIIGCVVILVYM